MDIWRFFSGHTVPDLVLLFWSFLWPPFMFSFPTSSLSDAQKTLSRHHEAVCFYVIYHSLPLSLSLSLFPSFSLPLPFSHLGSKWSAKALNICLPRDILLHLFQSNPKV